MSDLGFAIRMRAKYWRSSLLAVFSLALAIGANTALIGLLSAILLRPLPVRDPARLVTFSYSNPSGADLTSFSLPMYRRFRAMNQSFQDIAARIALSVNASIGDRTERAAGEIVTENYFSTLGVEPALGSLFSEGDNQGPAVAVLSYGYWQRRFRGSSSVLGTVMRINGQPVAIIGITPSGFDGTDPGISPDFRVPMSFHPHLMPWNATDNEKQRSFELFGRLAPGVTLERARAAARAVYRNSPLPRYAEEKLEVTAAANGRSQLRERYATPLLALEALALLLFLLAFANMTNLMLANVIGRRREISIRLALGADRWRLARQFLSESLLLAVAGAAGGGLLAILGGNVLIAQLPRGVAPLSLQLSLNLKSVVALSLMAAALGLVTALTMALVGARAWLATETRSVPVGLGHRSKLVGPLVSIQIALSMSMLAGAGLFVRTLHALILVDAGFATDHILLVPIAPATRDTVALSHFYAELTRQVAALPGVESAAVANLGLLTGTTWTFNVRPFDSSPLDTNGSGEPQWRADGDAVSAGFFHTVGTPITAGREFNESDGKGAESMVILNEAAARFYFPRGGAVGGGLRASGPSEVYQVIGVVKNMRANNLRDEPGKQIFFFSGQQILNAAMTLHVRTHIEPAALTGSVRAIVHQLAPDAAVYAIKTMERRRDEFLVRERLLAWLGAFFGGASALLAGIGLYGVLADSVSRRTREFGIRRAVGAQTGDILREIGMDAFRLTAAGFAVGIPLAIALKRSVAALLLNTRPPDFWTLAAAALACIVIAGLAAAPPGIRAARIEPAEALRDD